MLLIFFIFAVLYLSLYATLNKLLAVFKYNIGDSGLGEGSGRKSSRKAKPRIFASVLTAQWIYMSYINQLLLILTQILLPWQRRVGRSRIYRTSFNSVTLKPKLGARIMAIFPIQAEL